MVMMGRVMYKRYSNKAAIVPMSVPKMTSIQAIVLHFHR